MCYCWKKAAILKSNLFGFFSQAYSYSAIRRCLFLPTPTISFSVHFQVTRILSVQEPTQVEFVIRWTQAEYPHSVLHKTIILKLLSLNQVAQLSLKYKQQSWSDYLGRSSNHSVPTNRTMNSQMATSFLLLSLHSWEQSQDSILCLIQDSLFLQQTFTITIPFTLPLIPPEALLFPCWRKSHCRTWDSDKKKNLLASHNWFWNICVTLLIYSKRT